MMPTISKNNQGLFPSLFDEFNNLFNDQWMSTSFKHSTPAINVSEDEKEYKIEIAAPGTTREDFNLSVNNGLLSIKMEKRSDKTNEQSEKKYIRREFNYYKFEQKFTLPENIDENNIEAQMTNGVLCINLPKQNIEPEKPETRFIEIK
ncbi:MAG: Hsp20/alpha crystallin family protein [Bacteroidales bacterium]|nr:Hsp20/alpha crystallin family protein [Bacteroidales bacterium]MDD5974172.1 Hsp20/alpha crystallin family protein [Bacteroidales bacterium]MDY5193804.1 Hsp20/alpha crystallin family protein [Candidatus Aphodosoma sp.]